jgi:hypothetical protein
MLAAWIEANCPEQKGKSYDDLTPEQQAAFKKQYRAPGLTAEEEAELQRSFWRDTALSLDDPVKRKTYNQLTTEDREWVAKAFFDAYTALQKAGTKL